MRISNDVFVELTVFNFAICALIFCALNGLLNALGFIWYMVFGVPVVSLLVFQLKDWNERFLKRRGVLK